MSDLNNNMDKVFREKLGNYRKNPPDEIWDAIRTETDRRRMRKIIMVTWRVAAGIAIIITAGYFYYYFTHNGEQPLTDNFKKPETIIKQEKTDNLKLVEKPAIPQIKSDDNLPLANKKGYIEKSISRNETKELTTITEKAKIEVEFMVENEVKTEPEVKEKEEILLVSDLSIYLADLPSILQSFEFKPDRIPEKKKASGNLLKSLNPPVELDEEKTGRKDIWSISAQVSPTYNYRNLSQGVPNSIASINETESGKFSYAGGLQMGYKATERLSLFTGLMFSKIGFEIRNVQSYQADIRQSIGEVTLEKTQNTTNLYSVSNSTGYISSARTQNDLFVSNNSANQYQYTKTISPAFMSNIPGILRGSDKIDQYFQFVELPFILRYKVLDRKLRMNLLGGLSTNVLVGNRVFLVKDYSKSMVGETQGIRTVNYSGNIGFGFDYDLGKNFLFTVEPQFKYYLNNINIEAPISSRPYSIGMYTGIRYIF